MKLLPQPFRLRHRHGFTLVVALMLLAVMVLVVVGLFGSSVSSQVAGANDQQIERARAAARSGLARVQSLLEHATWNDDYVVLTHEQNPTATNERLRQPVLMIARPDLGADALLNVPCKSTQWNYVPLVSGADTLSAAAPGPLVNWATPTLALKSDPVTGQALQVATGLPRTLAWQPPVDTHWEVVYDQESSEPVARYCFWVEDMQSYLDLTKAGNYGDQLSNTSGMMARVHERETPVIFDSLSQVESPRDWYLGLAPGLRTPDDDPLTDDRQWALSQAALYSVFSPTLPDDSTGQQVDNALMLARWMPLRGTTTQHASLLNGPEDWKAALINLQPSLNWRTSLTRTPYDIAKTDPSAGRLSVPAARLIEENTIIGTQPYEEYQLIPSDYGVFAHPREPKLNLNRVLEQLARKQITRLDAVNQIADHIERHLPTPSATNSTASTPLTAPTMTRLDGEVFGFAQRSGAYPFPRRTSATSQTAASCRAYLQNLAASILDYADADCVPTIKEDTKPGTDVAWRGMDSAPVVSEHYVRYRLESVTDGIQISVTFYNELWNMSNLPVTGKFQQEYVSKATVPIGLTNPVPSLDLAQSYNKLIGNSKNDLKAESTSTGISYWMPLYESDGLGGLKSPITDITLLPNEYRVLATQTFTFKFSGGNTSGSGVSQVTVQQDLASYYRIRFDPAPAVQTPALFGVTPEDKTNMDDSMIIKVSSDTLSKSYALMDRCGIVRRNEATLNMTDSEKRQPHRGTAPGNATQTSAGFVNTSGDPRSAFYVADPQTAFDYAANSSLWGPTIRRGLNAQLLYYATYPGRWPDKGHNLDINRGVKAGKQEYEPFHKEVIKSKLKPEPWHAALAPMRISNAGRYFSVTELGNIHDPIFWDPNGPGSNPLDDTKKDLAPWKFYWDLGTKPDGITEETTVAPDARIAGGNTLRIGRPEHRLFRAAKTGGGRLSRTMSASVLLDLFHCGVSTVGATTVVTQNLTGNTTTLEQATANLSALTGPLAEINGHVNINTAKPEVLRALVAGTLVADQGQKTATEKWPALRPPKLIIPSATSAEADRLVEAIIRGRPYISPAAVADKAVDYDTSVIPAVVIPAFGVDKSHAGWNTEDPKANEWTDAAAEEVFARLYNSTTVRSRNFRIFVTGQALRARRSDPSKVDVLATRHRMYQVHVRPVRDTATGTIIRQRVEVTYEQDL